MTLGTGDVWLLHCLDKQSLGERAARFALARMQDRTVSGPVVERFSTDGNRVTLYFNHAFPLDTTAAPPQCFAISDSDGNVEIANVSIDSDTQITLWTSDKSYIPYIIWYAWGDNPVGATLRGIDGLAASPFRVFVSESKCNISEQLKCNGSDRLHTID